MKKILSILTIGIFASTSILTTNMTLNTNLKQKFNINDIHNTMNNNEFTDWNKLDFKILNNLYKNLEKIIYGQKYAIEKTNNTIINMYLDMNKIFNKNKTAGVLFLDGPPGVGKSFLPKALAENIFGKNNYKNYYYKFDMSDYNTIDATSNFIQDLKKIDGNKINILLFDEIEKSNISILDKFLPILEDGELNINDGNKINFSKSLIIFTSNIGASKINPKENDDEIREDFKKKVSDYFNTQINRSELLSRIGLNNIVPFDFIKDSSLKKRIISDNVKEIQENIRNKYNIELNVNIDEIFPLINKDFNIRLGTRAIFDSLQKNLVNPLAEFIFENKLDIDNFYKESDWEIISNLKDDKINYNFLANNNNYFEVKYRSIAHDWIIVKISKNIFKSMENIFENNQRNEKEKLFLKLINNFTKLNYTGSGENILESDYQTVVSVIIKHFDEIKNFFKTLPENKNLLITTNRIGSWDKNDKMGVSAA